MNRRIEPAQLFWRPDERVSVWAAIAARGHSSANINVVDLPKVGRSVVWGDATLIFACAFLEPDTDVVDYIVDYDRLTTLMSEAGIQQDNINALVYYSDGRKIWYRVTEQPVAVSATPQLPRGYTYEAVALSELGAWQIRFDNWLALCRWMTCARGADWTVEMIRLHKALNLHSCLTLRELLDDSSDQGLTLAAVARLLHSGLAEAELDDELISPSSIIRWKDRRSTAALSVQPLPLRKEGCRTPVDPSTAGMADRRDAIERVARRGRPRALVNGDGPAIALWPQPDTSALPTALRARYLRRKQAVLLYAANAPRELIKTETGLSLRATRRAWRRCLRTDAAGRQYGFFALLESPLGGYNRKAPIDPRRSMKSRGSSGALGQLLKRNEDLRDWLDTQIRSAPRRTATTIYGVRALQERFLKQLREHGLTGADWPFCRGNEAYQALLTYSKDLLSRIDAHERGPGAGNPKRALIQALRPLSMLQMDYQVAGAACVLRLKNQSGRTLCVPVQRWYIGVVGDEESQAIVGISIEFEAGPSVDTPLEAISSVIDPDNDKIYRDHLRYTADGKFLLRHFFPQIAWHGFSLLRVDNAWCNKAHDFVNNVIDTVGCVVQFGPAYQWWVRQFIEGLIGRLDSLGLSRMPTTYGTGPDDPRRKAPETKAQDLEVDVDEIVEVVYGAIAKFNLSRSECHQKSSRIEAIGAALERPQVGCFIQPLPLAIQKQNHLLDHVESRVIRGGGDQHESPYVRVDRCRYVSNRLTQNLVGRRVLVYINRRDARVARAVLCENGRDLGELKPTGTWSKSAVSWRRRKLINRGVPAVEQEMFNDPVEAWRTDKSRELAQKPKGKKGRATALALAAERSTRRRRGEDPVKPLDDSPFYVRKGDPATHPAPQAACPDPFGLRSTPTLGG